MRPHGRQGKSHSGHKALTVAIAGALAVPMAAQAVDFTISGQVNRALFITDTDGGTSAEVKNNGGSSTRVRANGSSELEGGGTVGIQFEYEESGTGVNLRHANLQYGGDFGKVTIGQGSEAGDGSQYSDTTGVNGIGHGAGTSTDFSLGDYFGSLDGGGRVNMIRYDTPSIGPISAAVSVANGDKRVGEARPQHRGCGLHVRRAACDASDRRRLLEHRRLLPDPRWRAASPSPVPGPRARTWRA